MKQYDVVIIGNGPVGMFTSSMAGYYNLTTLVVENQHEPGGQVSKFYPQKLVKDIPGFTSILGKDYINGLKTQQQAYSELVEVLYNIQITSYQQVDGLFYLFNDSNQCIAISKYIIFAYGKGSYEPIRFEINKQIIDFDNISYHLNPNLDYNNKHIVILGGGDSALDSAEWIKTNFSSASVSIIVRKSIAGKTLNENDFKRLNINTYLDQTILECTNNSLTIEDNTTKHLQTLSFDQILVQYGFKFSSEKNPFSNWAELKFDATNKLVVNEQYETSLSNVYAVGDCATQSGNPFYCIVSGQAQGFNVINTIKKQLNTK